MKTYEEFENQEEDFDKFVNVGEEVDYELMEYICYGWVPANYDDGVFMQCGECYTREGKTDYYETFKCERDTDRYFYVGLKADMQKRKPRKAVAKV
jgi:hypothetical protein